jgi:AcrR family transcriptional regulator
MNTEFPIHPTKLKLIETVSELLENNNEEEIISNKVLETSGISKGSLYHHFENFRDLLEDAHIVQFQRSLDSFRAKTNSFIKELTPSRIVNLNYMKTLKFISGPDLKKERMQMLHCLTMSNHHPQFTEKLKPSLASLDQYLSSIFGGPISASEKFDPNSAVIVIARALFFGRVSEDVKEDPMNYSEWNKLLDSLALVW